MGGGFWAKRERGEVGEESRHMSDAHETRRKSDIQDKRKVRSQKAKHRLT